MKLTESHLRVIIKEEIRGLLNPSNKQIRAAQADETAARHEKALAKSGDPVSQAEQDYSLKSTNLNNLAVELIKQDRDYVETFLSVDRNSRVKFENFVGPEFRKEFQDLADKADKEPNLNKLEEFKKLAMMFAPRRAGEGFGSKIARGLSTVYSPSTKE
jgi:hypothetical protein